MGHIHLITRDPQAVRRVWIDVLGAKPAKHGALDGARLQGMYVWIEKGEPSGGTDGSVIRDIGVRVRDLDGVLARAARDGFHARQASWNTAQLRAPDNVLLELVADPGIGVEVLTDHLHFLVPDATLARRWYSERFGHPIPGIRLDFITAGTSAGPTKGRAVDHIGFRVKNLNSYMDPAKAIPSKSAPATIPELWIKSVFLTDPWGTRIELSEELPEHSLGDAEFRRGPGRTQSLLDFQARRSRTYSRIAWPGASEGVWSSCHGAWIAYQEGEGWRRSAKWTLALATTPWWLRSECAPHQNAGLIRLRLLSSGRLT